MRKTSANNECHDADQAGRRISLLGSIRSKPALLTLERAAFTTDEDSLRAFLTCVSNVKNLGANDIYHWYLASSSSKNTQSQKVEVPADLKVNLIWPCTEQHVRKYSPQAVRMVTETAEIYAEYVRPFMQEKREQGRLNWVFNIIEGRTEQEDVIMREHSACGTSGQDEGYLMLPDLNWDRKTIGSLHLLALVERRDIWSLRDLKRSHVPWLKSMRSKLLDATVKLYPELERDQIKLYVHCTYFSL